MNVFKKGATLLRNFARKASNAAYAVAGALGLTLLGAEQGANAAPIDVTGVVTAINDTLGPIGLIGGAVLLVLVAVKTYKWVTRAM